MNGNRFIITSAIFFVFLFNGQQACAELLKVESTSWIASPNYPNEIPHFYLTDSDTPISTWQVTTTKDYLKLSFDNLSISNCLSRCACGRVEVIGKEYSDGRNKYNSPYCHGRESSVSSKDDILFVEYYASDKWDTFKATIHAKNRVLSVSAVEVVIPVAVGCILFSIIIAVVKITIIIPSPGRSGTSGGYETLMQSFPDDEAVASQQDLQQHPQGEVNMEGDVSNDETVLV